MQFGERMGSIHVHEWCGNSWSLNPSRHTLQFPGVLSNPYFILSLIFIVNCYVLTLKTFDKWPCTVRLVIVSCDVCLSKLFLVAATICCERPCSFFLSLLNKKNSAGPRVYVGKGRGEGHDLTQKKNSFYTGRQNPQIPIPHLHSSTVAQLDQALDLGFGMGQTRGLFFNPSLKFAPIGIRTQDLKSATRAT